MAYLDKNAILSSLTNEDIISICNKLGCSEYKMDSNGTLYFSTYLCHGGDSPYKLAYYPPKEGNKYGGFHCYTCGDSYNIIELVIRANRVKGHTITWFKALSWIASVTGKSNLIVSNEQISLEKINDWNWIKRFSQSRSQVGELPEYKESILDVFTYYPYQSWVDEGISPEVLSEFEIGYYPLKDCITIPHRDINNRLIGVRCRNLDPIIISETGKYIPMTIEKQCLRHPLGQNLYGININKERIRECGKVLLVEGEKSVLLTNTYFGDNSFALAVCGSNISSQQQKILLDDLKVREVILAFDKEYEEPYSLQAEMYKRKLLKTVAPLVPYCRVTMLLDDEGILDYKDSPCDKGRNVLLHLLDEKIEITSQDIKESTEGVIVNGDNIED